MRRDLRWAAAALLLAGLATALVAALNRLDETPVDDRPAVPGSAAQIARGEQLARAGNCRACHTAQGGAPFAGGRPITTPFGSVYSSNLTPDDATGLGRWNAGHFWRALHNGRSRDGRLLSPAFPYPELSAVTREDADALFAYLRSLVPVRQLTPPSTLRWGTGTQPALALWRALYFRPARFTPEPTRSAAWNRGAYLVRGLAHCTACHGRRNALGALVDADAGGRLPGGWFAPSLAAPDEAGVAAWSDDEVVALLQRGLSPHGSAMGPMAEVVYASTQHLPEADLRAIATYLRAWPTPRPAAPRAPPAVDPTRQQRGAALYREHCADCHGRDGRGVPGIYPPLAGNRLVTLDDPGNLLRAITGGGFPPATAGNPRPYGMPPFDLGHDELAALATYLRSAWGHRAAPLSDVEVLLAR